MLLEIDVTLWKTDRSPACRAVMMTLDAMNLSINEVDVNMDRGEHKTPEMLMRNPHQTLPVFQDKELIIRDRSGSSPFHNFSLRKLLRLYHAICTYLATQYSNSGFLIPKDPGGRALVEMSLHYNCGVLHPRYRAAADPILHENSSFVMPQQVCDIECAYADLECMLAGKEWFAGSSPTLADICLGATASTLHCLVPIDKLRYPRLSCWLFRMSEQVFYITANKTGLNEFVRRIGELRLCGLSAVQMSTDFGKKTFSGGNTYAGTLTVPIGLITTAPPPQHRATQASVARCPPVIA
ncbi:Glutathione S-transferase epsilon 11 [Operophtera brumata]|uniref:Glutathione S-transferase epsilon 11 n=1 Tax=Operophtera brumata TaxID=104452 RepID=A0A0L7LTL7_OPEBR|nr:Glutathione S-transferase epsilon 11 [Operophtera brumata]